MKTLLALLCSSLLLLSGCATERVTHTISLADGAIVIKTFNKPCELEIAKETARNLGASPKNVEDMVKAEAKFNGEEQARKACVFFTKDGESFHIIDEKGEIGMGLPLKGKD